MTAKIYFVAGSHWFRVSLAETGESRELMTIKMDGGHEWTFDEPSWRPIAFGSGTDSCFLWSARELILLPKSASEKPVVEVGVEEDLIFVFESDGGWVLVCESSVRRVLAGKQTARWELSDVVASATWRGEELAVLDEGGDEVLLRISGPDLMPVVR